MISAQDTLLSQLKYDEVIAYEYQGDGNMTISKCLKDKPELINQFKTLEPTQVKEIESVLNDTTTYGNSIANCFDPHFALIYKLEGKTVCTIDICIGCNYLISTSHIPASEHKKLYTSGKYSMPANGFSKKGRKEIQSFVKSLGFTEYLRPLRSIFDNR